VEDVRSQCRRLLDGRVMYVAEVLVVIQYNVLVVTRVRTIVQKTDSPIVDSIGQNYRPMQ